MKKVGLSEPIRGIPIKKLTTQTAILSSSAAKEVIKYLFFKHVSKYPNETPIKPLVKIKIIASCGLIQKIIKALAT